MSNELKDPTQQFLDNLSKAMPEVAASFFSKFPAKDNHKLNLYSDVLGFFAGCIISWMIQVNFGPYAKESFSYATTTVMCHGLTWLIWLLLVGLCLRTTFIRPEAAMKPEIAKSTSKEAA
ncbi:hypothetical protein ACK3ZH_01185 [Aeromonas caviae]